MTGSQDDQKWQDGKNVRMAKNGSTTGITECQKMTVCPTGSQDDKQWQDDRMAKNGRMSEWQKVTGWQDDKK